MTTITKPKGHSNAIVNQGVAISTTQAMIPIHGGATVAGYRPLPSLILTRGEWKTIGDRMNWWDSPPNTNGGCLWIQFHDRGGRVQVDSLTQEGIHAAKFQCEQMLEELETAQEALEATSDSDND